MDGLLEYYFKKNNVPAEKQAAVKSIVAWRELSNSKLPNARRRALFAGRDRGIKAFMDSTRDTEALANRAAQCDRLRDDQRDHPDRIFRRDAGAAAELNDAAEAVMKLLDKTIAECDAQQAQVLAGQTRPSPGLLAKWQALEDRMGGAKWVKAGELWAGIVSGPVEPPSAGRRPTRRSRT